MVALVAAGFLLGGSEAVVVLAVAGLIMLLGRFWWPLDVVRQLTWRLLEPYGLRRRREVQEGHERRRMGRVLGGAVWLVAGALLLLHLPLAAWTLAFLVAGM